jgi:hypothetical protein
MSQYASLKAIENKTGLEPIMVREYIEQGFGYFLNEPFVSQTKILSIEDLKHLEFKVISVKNTNIFNLNPADNYVVNDDMGLYTFFDFMKDDIVKMYSFNNEILSFSKEYIKQNKSDDEVLVSISFRRGDYLTQSSLNLSLDYYYDAISTLKERLPNVKFKYVIFSGAAYGDDGMSWVKNNFKINNAIYAENLDKYKQMCIMSLCDHNIIANSSFPWWGAYLNKNKNKIVICPFNYVNDVRFNDEINGKYFPIDWISIKTV